MYATEDVLPMYATEDVLQMYAKELSYRYGRCTPDLRNGSTWPEPNLIDDSSLNHDVFPDMFVY